MVQIDRSEAMGPVYSATLASTLGTLLAVLASSGLGLLIARSITKPAALGVQSVRRISRKAACPRLSRILSAMTNWVISPNRWTLCAKARRRGNLEEDRNRRAEEQRIVVDLLSKSACVTCRP